MTESLMRSLVLMFSGAEGQSKITTLIAAVLDPALLTRFTEYFPVSVLQKISILFKNKSLPMLNRNFIYLE